MVSDAASRRAPAATTLKGNIPACNICKRKIVDNAEAEQSYKFIADLLVEKEALEIEAKRQQCDKRNKKR